MYIPHLKQIAGTSDWTFDDAPEAFDDAAALATAPSRPITGAGAELLPRPQGSARALVTRSAWLVWQAGMQRTSPEVGHWSKEDQYWLLVGAAGPSMQTIFAMLKAGYTLSAAASVLAQIERAEKLPKTGTVDDGLEDPKPAIDDDEAQESALLVETAVMKVAEDVVDVFGAHLAKLPKTSHQRRNVILAVEADVRKVLGIDNRPQP
jgi:hypothetical protein